MDDDSNVVRFPNGRIRQDEVPEELGHEFVVICRCGSTSFHLVQNNTVECVNCNAELMHKSQPIRWQNKVKEGD